MPESAAALGRLAEEVRSKNAGPFWLTLDVFLRTDDDYDRVINSGILTADTIGRLYRIAPESIQVFAMPALRAVKISFPRPLPAGSFGDRDLHAGQQHVPLSSVIVPARPTSCASAPSVPAAPVSGR